MLKVGIKAPYFSLQDQNGNQVSLDDLKGSKFILYFYSKDMTSGCTKQACGFSELYPQFKEKGVRIIGVSKDTIDSHKKFIDKYGLPFTLLSDPDKKAISSYDVLKEKFMYGRRVMGVVRTTYLIDEEGIIIKAFSDVKADKNPKEMLEVLE